jgi:hypothetical protein
LVWGCSLPFLLLPNHLLSKNIPSGLQPAECRLQKVLFTFGYFSFFEYVAISRCYALGVLLIFILATLLSIQERPRNYLLIFIILGLLANVVAHAFILANALALVLVYEYFFKGFPDQKPDRYFWLGVVLLAAASLIAVLQLLPPSDSGYLQKWYFYFDWKRLGQTLATLYQALIAIPGFKHSFWNSYPIGVIGHVIFFLPLLWVTIVLLIRKPIPLFIYLFGVTSIWVFSYVKIIGQARHNGYIFILLITCLWIAQRYEESKHFSLKKIPTLQFLHQHRSRLITSLLVIQAIGGIYAVSMDLKYPFSTTLAAANFLKTYPHENSFLVGYPDFSSVAFAAYLHQEIYYPNHDRFGTFVIWDDRRRDLSTDEIIPKVKQMMEKRQEDAILAVGDNPLVRIEQLANVSEIKTFEGSLGTDENIYLYRIRH